MFKLSVCWSWGNASCVVQTLFWSLSNVVILFLISFEWRTRLTRTLSVQKRHWYVTNRYKYHYLWSASDLSSSSSVRVHAVSPLSCHIWVSDISIACEFVSFHEKRISPDDWRKYDVTLYHDHMFQLWLLRYRETIVRCKFVSRSFAVNWVCELLNG